MSVFDGPKASRTWSRAEVNQAALNVIRSAEGREVVRAIVMYLLARDERVKEAIGDLAIAEITAKAADQLQADVESLSGQTLDELIGRPAKGHMPMGS